VGLIVSNRGSIGRPFLWEHCGVTVDLDALVLIMPFSLGLGIELEAASPEITRLLSSLKLSWRDAT
jgi:hypothetical protein